MNFPAYVPNGAKQIVVALLSGDAADIERKDGLQALRAAGEARLKVLTHLLNAAWDPSQRAVVKDWIAELEEELAEQRAQINLLSRLGRGLN